MQQVTVIKSRLIELERRPAWLAEKLNVDQALVSRWLKGKRPIPQNRLKEIALVLGKQGDWLTDPDHVAA